MLKKVRLSHKHLKAIELKYLGFSYEEISNQVAISTLTLYKYFAINGKLYQPYSNYKRELDETIKENTKSLIERNTIEAFKVVLKVMNNEQNLGLSLKAAIYILELSQANSGDEKDKTLDTAEQILQGMEKRKVFNEI